MTPIKLINGTGEDMDTRTQFIAINQLVIEDLHKWNTQWVKEARFDLDKCPLLNMAEYLKIKLRVMAELN